MAKGKKGKSKKSSEEKVKIVEEGPPPEPPTPPEPIFMTEEALELREKWEKKPLACVPIQSPRSEFEFESKFESLPKQLSKIADLEIPYIRENGVRYCIEKLGEFFNCKDYPVNLLQFWFLDMVTDCLWRTQDDFKLPVNLQKIVLEWVLFIFDLIRDPEKNFSRKKLFKVFKEAISVAAEAAEEGYSILTPEQLFVFTEEEKNEDDSSSSGSSASLTSSSTTMSFSDEYDGASYVELQLDEEEPDVCLLEKEFCNCSRYSLSSDDTTEIMSEEASIEIVQGIEELDKIIPEESGVGKIEEANIVGGVEEKNEDIVNSLQEAIEDDADVVFYQADTGIPARFLPLAEDECNEEESNKSAEEEEHFCTLNYEEYKETEEQGSFDVYEVPENFDVISLSDCFTGSTSTITQFELHKPTEVEEPPVKQVSEVVVKNGEAKKGKGKVSIVDTDTSPTNTKKSKGSKSEAKVKISEIKMPIEEIPQKKSSLEIRRELEKEKVLERKILKKLANQKLWEQRLQDMADPDKGWYPTDAIQEEPVVSEAEDELFGSDEDWVDIEKQSKTLRRAHDKKIINYGVLWAIVDFVFDYFYDNFSYTLIKLAFHATPTIISQAVNDEWREPKLIKGELEKPKPEKVKKKKAKKEKKKKSAKGSKKGGKKKDKGKDKKSKKSKDSKKKKDKKKKPAKLTKEEKAELERLKQEQALLEEERLKREENRRFMFPLADAADDELFKNLFENWVKKDLSKKGKKGKKDKKDKKDKKGKKKK